MSVKRRGAKLVTSLLTVVLYHALLFHVVRRSYRETRTRNCDVTRSSLQTEQTVIRQPSLDAVYGTETDLGVIPSVAVSLEDGNSTAPNIVFYVWCRSGFFNFVHYLSVLSSIKLLRPGTVFFYYSRPPEVDVNLS